MISAHIYYRILMPSMFDTGRLSKKLVCDKKVLLIMVTEAVNE